MKFRLEETMTSFRNFLMILAVAALTFACVPNGNGPNGNNGDDDDDDTNVPSELTFSFDVKVLGESIVTGVYIDGEYAGESDEKFERPHRTTPYVVQVGDGDSWTGGGISKEENPRPITLVNGVYWVHPDLTIDPKEEIGDGKIEVHMNRYLAANYVCTREKCTYDENADDKKGSVCDPIREDDAQYIEVIHGHLLLPHDNPSLNTMHPNDRLGVVTDRLELSVSNEPDIRLEDSWVSDDNWFGFWNVQQEAWISFVTCEPV